MADGGWRIVDGPQQDSAPSPLVTRHWSLVTRPTGRNCATITPSPRSARWQVDLCDAAQYIAAATSTLASDFSSTIEGANGWRLTVRRVTGRTRRSALRLRWMELATRRGESAEAHTGR
jgi:hypothetical protein